MTLTTIHKTPRLWLWAIFLIQPLLGFAQMQTHSFEEIDQLQHIENKNIVVFISTSWCKYCRAMENTTFKQPEVIALLNSDFLYTELDAEEERDISFNGHIFKFRPTGTHTGIHELAAQLATVDGKMSFPTLYILNPDYEIIFQYNQFLSAEDLLKVLNALTPGT